MCDDVGQRRGDATIRRQWATALAAFDQAELSYQPINAALQQFERRYFSSEGEFSAASQSEIADRQSKKDEAMVLEDRFGRTLYAAARVVQNTPAPDLSGVIRKLELLRDLAGNEDTGPIIVDLHRLRALYAGDAARP